MIFNPQSFHSFIHSFIINKPRHEYVERYKSKILQRYLTSSKDANEPTTTTTTTTTQFLQITIVDRKNNENCTTTFVICQLSSCLPMYASLHCRYKVPCLVVCLSLRFWFCRRCGSGHYNWPDDIPGRFVSLAIAF